jgi:hypothetical protein
MKPTADRARRYRPAVAATDQSARTNTVQRIYVLVDPDATRVVHDLTDGLPVEIPAEVKTAVGVNLRLVLPPEMLRDIIADLSHDTARWLRGDTATLQVRVNLQPVVANIAGAATEYLGGWSG